MTNLRVNKLDFVSEVAKRNQKKDNMARNNISCFHSGLMNHVFKEKTGL